MAEVDYQMALLLQYKFEQEHKRKECTDSDLKLAQELQEQFQAEAEVEQPKNNLVYKAPALNSSKCLVDPSWEVIDPTPDVHVLFMAFNQRFFWNSLGSVTVSWSKRMTTCAGICAYQGRGGLCSITLSEPLLKLRPRKDLVETLLHEMIHAYLFVTNNNRDRDGHGPEFHKHMYRINAEAGTNITVYHDFHDEVKLYQQHWWRCDGPCQHRKPYFGIVRRATNRCPGPNDRWWGEHMRNCGGTFVKVKSPEKPVKESKMSAKKKVDPPKQTSPKSDIRNYLKTTAAVPKNDQNNKENTITNSLPNNVRTVSSNAGSSSPQVGNVIPSKTSNIFGFTVSVTSSKKPSGGVKGAIKNAGSSTFVVTSKTNNNNNSERPSTSIADVKPFSGTGKSLSTSSLHNTGDYSVVRDHWLKKFEQTGTKRRNSSTCPCNETQKLPKLMDSDKNTVECPICQSKFKPEALNAHLDTCLEASNTSKECIICGVDVSSKNYEKHVSDCTAKHFADDDIAIDLTSPEKESTKNCPVCKEQLASNVYDMHVQACILGMCDEFDQKYDIGQNAKTACLACGKDILKSELDSHLEDCMSMNNVFDTSNVPVEEDLDESDQNRYNCPFCLEEVSEKYMQGHLDRCLVSEDDAKEKSLLVESLCCDDSDSN